MAMIVGIWGWGSLCKVQAPTLASGIQVTMPVQKNHESKALEGAAASDPCVGEYELRSDLALTIRRVGDHLFFQVPGHPPLKLVRQRDGVYFLATMDDTITFVRNGQGIVLALLLRQGPVETLALKRGPVG